MVPGAAFDEQRHHVRAERVRPADRRCQPITSVSCRSPRPWTSAPASSSARTVSRYPRPAAKCNGAALSPASRASGSAPCSSRNRTTSACPRPAAACNPVLPRESRARGRWDRPRRAAARQRGRRSDTRSPVARPVQCGAARRAPQGPPAGESVLPRNVEERGGQLDLGIGTAERAKAIFSSFFRYSSEGRSGSGDCDMDPYLPWRPASAFLGLEVRVTDCSELSKVGSTLYADRRPPCSASGILWQRSSRSVGLFANSGIWSSFCLFQPAGSSSSGP